MFQTGIHIALQSQASDWLTWLMLQVTATGYYRFVIVMVIAVLFGVSLRKGFLLFQIIAWTAMLSEIAKQFFGLPRPFFADARVACLDPGWDAATAFRAMGGEGFFDLPRQAVIDAFRAEGPVVRLPLGPRLGSGGHVGRPGGRLPQAGAGLAGPVLRGADRLHPPLPGRPFPGRRPGRRPAGRAGPVRRLEAHRQRQRARERFFAAAAARLGTALPGVLYYFFLFVLPVLLALFSLFSAMFAGFFVGLNAAFTLALRSGLPVDQGLPVGAPGARRARRAALPAARPGAGTGARPGPGRRRLCWGSFLTAGLGTFLTVWGGIKLLLLLGLYRRQEMPAA